MKRAAQRRVADVMERVSTSRVIHTDPLLALLNALLRLQRAPDHIPIKRLPLPHPPQILRIKINDSRSHALHVVLLTADNNRAVLERRGEKVREQVVSLLRHPWVKALKSAGALDGPSLNS